MKRDDYRREFAGFQFARAQARQDGWRQSSPFEPLPARIHDRFSDLWSLTAVETLRGEREADQSRPEVERRGGDVLRAVAETWLIRAQCREIETELHRALTAPFIAWQGGRHAAVALAAQAARETDPAQRRALESKLAAHYAGLVDLREQRREVSAAATRRLGYASPAAQAAAHAQALMDEDLAPWMTACERFLADTDADAPRAAALRSDPPADDPFEARLMRRAVEATLRNLGARPWQQANVTTIWQATGAAGVFRARVPEDIRWAVTMQPGWQAWQRLLGELARVQQAAWTSTKLPIELRSHGDPALAETWQRLFAGLLFDPHWTTSLLDIQPPPALRRAMAAARQRLARRAALRCVAWHGRETAGWTLERLRAEFEQRLGASLSDWELLDELEAAPLALARLRGDWLAAALDDWLRTRYGHWHVSRRAGDDLIDLWNTGFRYPAGRLAALVGVGPIGPEAWLSELARLSR
ncbi:MAG: hypothetical protein CFK52_10025 [Chloracidobacterium sp. CP2_5A]|nr:MAG: hypothetical protein CFK52_10025 [Chloracidobacterium sp. CP2_5A]